jgi:hypothetical protein
VAQALDEQVINAESFYLPVVMPECYCTMSMRLLGCPVPNSEPPVCSRATSGIMKDLTPGRLTPIMSEI